MSAVNAAMFGSLQGRSASATRENAPERVKYQSEVDTNDFAILFEELVEKSTNRVLDFDLLQVLVREIDRKENGSHPLDEGQIYVIAQLISHIDQISRQNLQFEEPLEVQVGDLNIDIPEGTSLIEGTDEHRNPQSRILGIAMGMYPVILDGIQDAVSRLGSDTNDLPDYSGLRKWLDNNSGLVALAVVGSLKKNNSWDESESSSESSGGPNGFVIAIIVACVIAIAGGLLYYIDANNPDSNSGDNPDADNPDGGSSFNTLGIQPVDPEDPPPTVMISPTSTPDGLSPESTVTPEPTPVPMTMDDVNNMSDEDKLAHVTGYEGSNMSVSTIHPHIVLIDGDGDYVAYNILTDEVTDLEAVGIAMLETKSGGVVEYEGHTLHSIRAAIEADNPNLKNNEYKNPDTQDGVEEYAGWIYRELDVDMEGFRGGFQMVNSQSGQVFGVFVMGITDINGDNKTLIIYRDSNAVFQGKIVSALPEEVMDALKGY